MLFILFLLLACFFNVSYSVIDRSDFMTWLVKSVCFSNDTILSADPYYNCPEGSELRKLKPGESFPYTNYEQTSSQISDSFALVDNLGNNIILHSFDYMPFNDFNQHSGSDGYDVYSIGTTDVSVSNTKDGGGYGSTFFGNKCSYGNGWALFPKEDFLVGGQGFWPISGVYWEQSGQEPPGKCPSSYSTNTLTLWQLYPSFNFGDTTGNALKIMDTVVSYHGFETDDGETPTSSFLAQGHLEVFYFTEFYGITRWEVWVPPASTAATTTITKASTSYRVGSGQQMLECSGSAEAVFKGQSFLKTNCHDWSNVKMLAVPVLPLWPIINSNLLQHFHFTDGLSDADGLGLWHR